jgi:hypothetical protein
LISRLCPAFDLLKDEQRLASECWRAAGSLAALEMSGKSCERGNAGMYAVVVGLLPRSAATLTKIDMR